MPTGKVKYTGPARLSRYRPPVSRAVKKRSKDEQMGTRIRLLRTELRLTQEDVAAQVGVTKSAVSQWESGEYDNIKLNNFRELLAVLKTDWEYLIYGTVVPKAVETAE